MTSKRDKPVKHEARGSTKGAWQFIDVSELRGGKNEELRKVVRSNAMRDYRAKNKAKQSTAKAILEKDSRLTTHHSSSDSSPAPTTRGSDSESPPPDKSASMLLQDDGGRGDPVFYWPSEWESTLREVESLTISPTQPRGTKAPLNRHPQNRVVSPSCQPSSKASPVDRSLTLHASPGNNSAEPFGVLPCSAPESLELMNHFNFIFRSKTAPGPHGEPSPMTTQWLPLTFTDPLLFVASINFAAAHRDLLESRPNQRMSLQRKSRAIDMINARLNCPKAAISDGSIGAVCLLAATARVNGNLDELRMHLAVLPRLVELRGGSEHLRKTHEVMHMFVIWEDMLSAIVLSSPPQFHHPPNCAMTRLPLLYPHMAHPEFPPSHPLHPIFTSLAHLAAEILRPLTSQDVENMSPQLLSIIDATNPNCLSDPAAYDGTFTPATLARFAKERGRIDQRLLSMRQLANIPVSERNLNDYAYEAARLGCRIYTHTVLSRNLPQPLSLLMKLAADSITLIITAERNGLLDLPWRCPPNPFIWLLCLGGVMPLTEEQENWFAQKIVQTVRHCEIFREFARGDLGSRGMVWGIGLATSPVRGLWRRVEGIWQGERRERMGGEEFEAEDMEAEEAE